MKLRVSGRILLYFTLLALGASGFLFTLFMPHPQGFYAFIALAALSGFCVSANIYDTKRRGEQLVCPTGSNCNAVITSRYSKFFGISLERLGMAYFGVIAIAYLALTAVPEMFTPPLLFAVVLLSILAGFFSIYLLFVQAFLLRQWCIWCILTAMFSLSIFVLSFISAEQAVLFLSNISGVLEMIKHLGFALGVGAATSAVFLFFHFLEDETIEEKELKTIKGISELVWVGFALVLVSRLASYISHSEALSQSPSFIIQMIALFVFAFTGAVLMIIYAPFLVYMPFQRPSHQGEKSPFSPLRRPTAALGLIAVSSWYFAFAMNFITETSLIFLGMVFLIILVGMTALALIWDRSLHYKAPSSIK